MLHLACPTARQLDALARERGHLTFTHKGVGATRPVLRDGRAPAGAIPVGFDIDRYSELLGKGRATFERACAAVRRFEMYPSGWTRVHHPPGDEAIREGKVFVAVVRHFGFYSALPCRIVYVLDDQHSDGPGAGERSYFGFALGTLPGHAECGEERFTVSWDARDDTVHYEVMAFSRPMAWYARAGYPIARMLQKRFARDSRAGMVRAASER